ncbi:hypothetical protein BD626DRAFT_11655 [Schizophyllum amplum]|uniref:Uncharacterized protein n=1 Tax=Schizophyllum amplum TaxID=97359 RepID=A0A550CX78_9AGAR|nr:hypothetical protein BD626DRAFT_11655 [Auriculariopsis ampla]
MPFPIAPALLVGIGARILVDAFSSDPSSPLRSALLQGAWQGIALSHAIRASPDLALPAVLALGVGAKVIFDITAASEPVDTDSAGALDSALSASGTGRAVATLIGLALGFVGADMLAAMVEEADDEKDKDKDKKKEREKEKEKERDRRRARDKDRHKDDRHRERHRTGDERALARKDRRERRVSGTGIPPMPLLAPPAPYPAIVRPPYADSTPTPSTTSQSHIFSNNAYEDITTVDTNSTLISSSRTPQEREIAALRARASLADSERRRFKEEKKWAQAANDTARAAQMAWQVKRYKALMRSFTREADAKIVALNTQPPSKAPPPIAALPTRSSSPESFTKPMPMPVPRPAPIKTAAENVWITNGDARRSVISVDIAKTQQPIRLNVA